MYKLVLRHVYLILSIFFSSKQIQIKLIQQTQIKVFNQFGGQSQPTFLIVIFTFYGIFTKETFEQTSTSGQVGDRQEIIVSVIQEIHIKFLV